MKSNCINMKRSIFWDTTPCSPLVDFQQSTQQYIPEDRTLNNHHCKNLKSYKLYQTSKEWFMAKNIYVQLNPVDDNVRKFHNYLTQGGKQLR